MSINLLGLASALASFLGIWLGHLAVRKIESTAPKLWPSIAAAILLGLLLETWSLVAGNLITSAVTGILGITVLWDALEFKRQEKRVRKGHAPANPANLRHARFLAEHSSATPLDLLERDPVGRPVSAEEAIQLVNHQGHEGTRS